jgi:hypothetical protein
MYRDVERPSIYHDLLSTPPAVSPRCAKLCKMGEGECEVRVRVLKKLDDME